MKTRLFHKEYYLNISEFHFIFVTRALGNSKP
jgi:hypothetical protein